MHLRMTEANLKLRHCAKSEGDSQYTFNVVRLSFGAYYQVVFKGEHEIWSETVIPLNHRLNTPHQLKSEFRLRQELQHLSQVGALNSDLYERQFGFSSLVSSIMFELTNIVKIKCLGVTLIETRCGAQRVLEFAGETWSWLLLRSQHDPTSDASVRAPESIRKQ